jgi:hypothetical protein
LHLNGEVLYMPEFYLLIETTYFPNWSGHESRIHVADNYRHIRNASHIAMANIRHLLISGTV